MPLTNRQRALDAGNRQDVARRGGTGHIVFADSPFAHEPYMNILTVDTTGGVVIINVAPPEECEGGIYAFRNVGAVNAVTLAEGITGSVTFGTQHVYFCTGKEFVKLN